MKTDAVIFSAGMNKKEDNWFSLMKIGSIPMIQRQCITLHAAGVESIFILCGADEKREIERLNIAIPIMFVEHENIEKWAQEIACDRLVLVPTSHPFFTIQTIIELLQCEDFIVSPKYKEKIGYPIVLSNEVFLRNIVQEYDNSVNNIADFPNLSGMTYLPVEDDGIFINIGNKKEYEQALAENNLLNWYPKVKFRITNEEPFFGPGSVELLTKIEKTKSVRLASEQMQMSYSKSWKLLNELEKQCGYEVLTRTKGGKGGGQTTLTQKGKVLLTWYETLKKQVDAFAVQLFLENLPPR